MSNQASEKIKTEFVVAYLEDVKIKFFSETGKIIGAGEKGLKRNFSVEGSDIDPKRVRRVYVFKPGEKASEIVVDLDYASMEEVTVPVLDGKDGLMVEVEMYTKEWMKGITGRG